MKLLLLLLASVARAQTFIAPQDYITTNTFSSTMTVGGQLVAQSLSVGSGTAVSTITSTGQLQLPAGSTVQVAGISFSSAAGGAYDQFNVNGNLLISGAIAGQNPLDPATISTVNITAAGMAISPLAIAYQNSTTHQNSFVISGGTIFHEAAASSGALALLTFSHDVSSGTLSVPQKLGSSGLSNIALYTDQVTLSTGTTRVVESAIKTLTDSVGTSTTTTVYSLPSDLSFSTVRQGGVTLTEGMRLDSNGALDIGVTTGTATSLTVRGPNADPGTGNTSTGTLFGAANSGNTPNGNVTQVVIQQNLATNATPIGVQTALMIENLPGSNVLEDAGANTYLLNMLLTDISQPTYLRQNVFTGNGDFGMGTSKPQAHVHISSGPFQLGSVVPPNTSLLIDGNAATALQIGPGQGVAQASVTISANVITFTIPVTETSSVTVQGGILSPGGIVASTETLTGPSFSVGGATASAFGFQVNSGSVTTSGSIVIGTGTSNIPAINKAMLVVDEAGFDPTAISTYLFNQSGAPIMAEAFNPAAGIVNDSGFFMADNGNLYMLDASTAAVGHSLATIQSIASSGTLAGLQTLGSLNHSAGLFELVGSMNPGISPSSSTFNLNRIIFEMDTNASFSLISPTPSLPSQIVFAVSSPNAASLTDKMVLNSSGTLVVGPAKPAVTDPIRRFWAYQGNALIDDNITVTGVGGGSAGLTLGDNVPSATAATLYNSGGALFWNGSPVSSAGGGATLSGGNTNYFTMWISSIQVGNTNVHYDGSASVTFVGSSITAPGGIGSAGTITGGAFVGVSGATETTTAALLGVGTAANPLDINSSSVAVLSGGYVLDAQLDPSSVTKQGFVTLGNLAGAVPASAVSLATVTVQFNAVATSTNALQAELNNVGTSTTSIAASTTTLASIKASTGTCTLPTFPITLNSGNVVCTQPSNVTGNAATVTNGAYTNVANTFTSSQTFTNTASNSIAVSSGVVMNGAATFSAPTSTAVFAYYEGNGAGLTGISATFTGGYVPNTTTFGSSVTINNASGLSLSTDAYIVWGNPGAQSPSISGDLHNVFIEANSSSGGSGAVKINDNSITGTGGIMVYGGGAGEVLKAQIGSNAGPDFVQNNLGVGTASPGTTLDVNGASTIRGAETVTSSVTVQGTSSNSIAVSSGIVMNNAAIFSATSSTANFAYYLGNGAGLTGVTASFVGGYVPNVTTFASSVTVNSASGILAYSIQVGTGTITPITGEITISGTSVTQSGYTPLGIIGPSGKDGAANGLPVNVVGGGANPPSSICAGIGCNFTIGTAGPINIVGGAGATTSYCQSHGGCTQYGGGNVNISGGGASASNGEGEVVIKTTATFSHYVGINTASPSTNLEVNGSAQIDSSLSVTGPSSVGTSLSYSTLSVYGISTASNTIPSVSCTAGSPSMTAGSTTEFGSYSAGVAATGCTVTFGTAFPNSHVFCQCQATANLLVYASAYSSTSVTCTSATAMTGDTITYFCRGGAQ